MEEENKRKKKEYIKESEITSEEMEYSKATISLERNKRRKKKREKKPFNVIVKLEEKRKDESRKMRRAKKM